MLTILNHFLRAGAANTLMVLGLTVNMTDAKLCGFQDAAHWSYGKFPSTANDSRY